MKINEFCRAKRRELGISQRELAEALNIRIATISDFERGVNGISSNTLNEILPLLNIELVQQSRVEKI